MALYLGALHLRIPPRDWRLIVMRAVAEVGAAYFFLTALLQHAAGQCHRDPAGRCRWP